MIDISDYIFDVPSLEIPLNSMSISSSEDVACKSTLSPGCISTEGTIRLKCCQNMAFTHSGSFCETSVMARNEHVGMS
jgi:hypothetical protein